MLSQKARDTSAYIFGRLTTGGQVEALKMQKLMYYTKGWSLALQNNPLFEDQCQAWKHGPVISDLYAYHRGTIILPNDWENSINGNSSRITGKDKIVADFVIQKYGAMSGWGLRNLTHTETPWIEAWKASGYGEEQSYIIEEKSIKKYFQSLINK